jgi:hypothetical protein
MSWFKTPQEVNEEKKERQAVIVRLERNQRLQKARAWLERHRDELVMGIPPTLDCTEQELLYHIQALRDVPRQSGFPENVLWPEDPQSTPP